MLWYCLRPFLLYLILFAVLSAGLDALFNRLLSSSSEAVQNYAFQNAGMLFGIFYAAVYAAGLLVMFRPARAEIHYYERIPSEMAGVRQERALYPIMLAGTLCLALFINLFLNYTGLVQADAAMQSSQNIEALMGLPLCTAVFGILAPLTEECVFRAILFGRLERGFGKAAALVLSSALFALYHGNLPQMVYAFCMGLVFAGAYHLTHRFLLPYLMHACTNIFVLVLSFTGLFEAICRPVYILAFGGLAVISGRIVFHTLKNSRK